MNSAFKIYRHRVDFVQQKKNPKKPPPDLLNERREASLILERYLGGDEHNIKEEKKSWNKKLLGRNIEANFEKDGNEKIKEAFEDSETWSECWSLQLKAALIVALKKEKETLNDSLLGFEFENFSFWSLSFH